MSPPGPMRHSIINQICCVILNPNIRNHFLLYALNTFFDALNVKFANLTKDEDRPVFKKH